MGFFVEYFVTLLLFGLFLLLFGLIFIVVIWAFFIIIVGGQNLSFCIGLKVPFTNNNTSEEKKALGKA